MSNYCTVYLPPTITTFFFLILTILPHEILFFLIQPKKKKRKERNGRGYQWITGPLRRNAPSNAKRTWEVEPNNQRRRRRRRQNIKKRKKTYSFAALMLLHPPLVFITFFLLVLSFLFTTTTTQREVRCVECLIVRCYWERLELREEPLSGTARIRTASGSSSSSPWLDFFLIFYMCVCSTVVVAHFLFWSFPPSPFTFLYIFFL